MWTSACQNMPVHNRESARVRRCCHAHGAADEAACECLAKGCAYVVASLVSIGGGVVEWARIALAIESVEYADIPRSGAHVGGQDPSRHGWPEKLIPMRLRSHF